MAVWRKSDGQRPLLLLSVLLGLSGLTQAAGIKTAGIDLAKACVTTWRNNILTIRAAKWPEPRRPAFCHFQQ
ncbi:hypothetical protein SAMN04487787_106159 [Kosakonia sacchari]|nr:hypothetical protein SAMN04487787_106159 [Kosakonia sacchari]